MTKIDEIVEKLKEKGIPETRAKIVAVLLCLFVVTYALCSAGVLPAKVDNILTEILYKLSGGIFDFRDVAKANDPQPLIPTNATSTPTPTETPPPPTETATPTATETAATPTETGTLRPIVTPIATQTTNATPTGTQTTPFPVNGTAETTNSVCSLFGEA